MRSTFIAAICTSSALAQVTFIEAEPMVVSVPEVLPEVQTTTDLEEPVSTDLPSIEET
jgi:hypothetical protein